MATLSKKKKCVVCSSEFEFNPRRFPVKVYCSKACKKAKSNIAAYHREYYLNNKEKWEPYKQTYSDTKAHLVSYKGGKCHDCGGVFPQCCYDFDHRVPMEKSFGVGGRNHSLEEKKIEADKCDLVCANCHRIRTAGNPLVSEKLSKGHSKNFMENSYGKPEQEASRDSSQSTPRPNFQSTVAESVDEVGLRSRSQSA